MMGSDLRSLSVLPRHLGCCASGQEVVQTFNLVNARLFYVPLLELSEPLEIDARTRRDLLVCELVPALLQEPFCSGEQAFGLHGAPSLVKCYWKRKKHITGAEQQTIQACPKRQLRLLSALRRRSETSSYGYGRGAISSGASGPSPKKLSQKP